jgi:hypothetical protein
MKSEVSRPAKCYFKCPESTKSQQMDYLVMTELMKTNREPVMMIGMAML